MYWKTLIIVCLYNCIVIITNLPWLPITYINALLLITSHVQSSLLNFPLCMLSIFSAFTSKECVGLKD